MVVFGCLLLPSLSDLTCLQWVPPPGKVNLNFDASILWNTGPVGVDGVHTIVSYRFKWWSEIFGLISVGCLCLCKAYCQQGRRSSGQMGSHATSFDLQKWPPFFFHFSFFGPPWFFIRISHMYCIDYIFKTVMQKDSWHLSSLSGSLVLFLIIMTAFNACRKS